MGSVWMRFGLLAALAAPAGCAGPAAPVITAVSSLPPTMDASRQPVRTVQAPGASCAELVQAFADTTKTPWRLRDDSYVNKDAPAKPGARQCEAETSSTAKNPPALLSVLLYRPDPDRDTPQDVVERARRRSEKCTTALPGPPAEVTFATSCTVRRATTITSSNTVLAGPAGFVSVFVTAQHSGSREATTEAEKFAAATSRRGAALAFPLI